MRQVIELTQGQEDLCLQSDGYSDCLRLYDQVMAVLWRTHYQYFAVAKRSSSMSFLTMSITDLSAADSEAQIMNELAKLFRYFEQGQYEVSSVVLATSVYEIVHDQLGYHQSLDGDAGYFSYCHHTEKDLIAFTKSYDDLDRALVEGYKYQLLEMQRSPFVITYQAQQFGEDAFVIDGHHKLVAYHELALPVPLLRIKKMGTSSVLKSSKTLGLAYQELMNAAEQKHYQRISR